MAFFKRNRGTRNPAQRQVYALYEIVYTIVDLTAAILFLVGSVLFFYPAMENQAIWCFVIGSACFALKPTLRVVREFHMLSISDYEDLAERAEG